MSMPPVQPPFAHDAVPPQVRATRAGKAGFWLAVVTLLLATVLPAIGWLVFIGGGLNWVAGGDPSGYGAVALVAALLALVITALPWLTAIPATVLGIVSLARSEQPRWWAVVALMAIPIVVLCWFIASAVASAVA